MEDYDWEGDQHYAANGDSVIYEGTLPASPPSSLRLEAPGKFAA
jgi:hypothetical protein